MPQLDLYVFGSTFALFIYFFVGLMLFSGFILPVVSVVYKISSKRTMYYHICFFTLMCAAHEYVLCTNTLCLVQNSYLFCKLGTLCSESAVSFDVSNS